MPYKDPAVYANYQKKWREENKESQREKGRIWREKNKERSKKRQHAWYMKNRVLSSRVLLTEEEKKQKRRASWEKWYSKNQARKIEHNKKWVRENRLRRRTSENAYKQNKRRFDVSYKISVSLRSRLREAIYSNQKSGSAIRDLGCSVPELKVYLEKQFKPGMTWSNWNFHGWHIDHITPLSAFDLSNREQFIRACHYTNLQPLWAKENLSKGKKI